jgi:hypothetical protein
MSYDEGGAVLIQHPPKCGKCKHWHRMHDADNLKPPYNGQCRQSLQASAIPVGGGKFAFIPFYAVVPDNFDGCSHFVGDEERE